MPQSKSGLTTPADDDGSSAGGTRKEVGLYEGDARDCARWLDRIVGGDGVTATITSPPYAWLKDYGIAGQIGHGQRLDEYLADCGAIFDAIGARTRPDGSLWLVVDSLVDQRPEVSRLVPLPFLLSDVAGESGWTLRDTIIWKKDRGAPWSGRGRLRNAFEYVLHFVRSSAFKYRLDRLRDPTGLARWWVRFPERYHPKGAAPTNVWEFPSPVQGSWPGQWGRHACPMPLGLIERIVALSTDPDDVVFDPFAGTGAVVAQATAMGRIGVGLELRSDYVASYSTILDAVRSRMAVERMASPDDASVPSPELILQLRMLKLPRTLIGEARRAFPSTAYPSVALCGALDASDEASPGAVDLAFVVDRKLRVGREMAAAIQAAARRPPASKFGLKPTIHLVPPDRIDDWMFSVKANEWWLYPNGRTWLRERPVTAADVAELAERNPSRNPSVVAPVEVALTP